MCVVIVIRNYKLHKHVRHVSYLAHAQRTAPELPYQLGRKAPAGFSPAGSFQFSSLAARTHIVRARETAWRIKARTFSRAPQKHQQRFRVI